MKNLSILLATIVLGAFTTAHGKEMLGAEALMKRMQADLSGGADAGDPMSKFRKAYKSMESGEQEATPEKWLELFDTFLEIPKNQRNRQNYGSDNLQFAGLFKVLPPSAAWPELRALIDKRPEGELRTACLKLLFDVLATTDGDIAASLETFQKSYQRIADGETSTNLDYYMESMLKRVRRADANTARDLVKMLDSVGPGADPFNGYLEVPDLSKVPKEEAKNLLLRILDYHGKVSFENDLDAARMAAVILENPDKLKAPMWELVKTKEDVALFELFLTKPDKERDVWNKSEAKQIYIVGLLAAGRLEDAQAYLLKLRATKGEENISLNSSLVDELSSGQKPEDLFVLFKDLLTKDPGMDVWPVYLDLAARSGKTEEALAFLKAALGNEGDAAVSQDVRESYSKALLESGKTDAAIAFLRGEVARYSAMDAPTEQEAKAFLNSSLRLIRIGTLLGKNDLVEEGFANADKAVPLERKFSSYHNGVDGGYFDLLLEHGKFAEAEEAVAEELVLKSKTEDQNRRDRKTEMTQLVYVYSKAGHHADVIKLLDEGTMWDAGDLSEINNGSIGDTSLYTIAAEAMLQTGQTEKALSIVKRTLAKNPGNDRAYAILLKIGADGTLDLLDQLAAANPFQERPLIWKAQILADQGKLEEAEKTVMAGIGIDPSDGEQGSGDRMRAYEILADILEKRGDGKKSDFMRGVVKAIRISEKADRWWSAGMTGQALALYEEALKEFADAYCIQSRLALRYSDLGNFEKAAEHYQRAFELMPSSFGRVESHCFGCEGAFSGEIAQQIAEQTFEELAEKTPDNPQVFYLLGYLRESQGKEADAAVQYAKAVELDPLYINAWKKLQAVAEAAKLPAEKVDDISLNIYRLDPKAGTLSKMKNLGKLWDTVLAVDAKLAPEETGPLYPLPESKSASEQDRYHDSEDSRQPRNQLAANNLFQSVIRLVENSL